MCYQRVGVLCCLCLAAFGATAADWGEPVTVIDDPQFSKPDARIGFDCPVVDAAGRMWTKSIGPDGNQYLCTFEDGRWQPVKLGSAEMGNRQEGDPASGPNGDAVYVWTPAQGGAKIITELRDLRCRHSSPTPMPPGELRIYEDGQKEYWLVMSPAQQGIDMLLARPEELRLVHSTKIQMGGLASGEHQGYPRRVVAHGRGHYWLYLSNLLVDQGMAGSSGVTVVDTVGDLSPTALQAPGWHNGTRSVTLVEKDGHIDFGASPFQTNPGSDDYWILRKDEQSIWMACAYGVAEIDTGTLKPTMWWTSSSGQSTGSQLRPFRGIDIKIVGERWLLATEKGAYWLEKGRLDRVLDGPALTESTDGGLWLHGTAPDTSLPLAFLPEDGGPMRWVGWPEGVFPPPRTATMCRTAGGILCIYGLEGIFKLSRDEEQKLKNTVPAVPASLRCRLFANASMPLTAPNGDVLLFSIWPGCVVHRLSSGAWSAWSPPDVPAESWNLWFVTDDRNRVWILYPPDEQDEQQYLVHDPATGKTLDGKSLKAALDDPTLCPDHFLGAPGEYRVPVVGKDGFAAVVTDKTLQCRVKGAWLPQVHYIKSFSEDSCLDGACYMDDNGRLCANAKGRVFTLTPGEMLFKSVPDLPARHTRIVEWYGNNTGGPGAPKSEVQCTDALGIAWRIKDGALSKDAWGLSVTVVPATEPAPFRNWKHLAQVIPGHAGDLFLRANDLISTETVHIRNAMHDVETKVTAMAETAGMVKLAFGDVAGLSHAWRLDQEPWQHTEEREALAGPYTPGAHVLKVYAFDAGLNVDPTPEEIPVTIAGSESPAEVIDALLHGSAEQQKWGLDALKKDPEEGVATVKQALEETKNGHSRWVLEAVLQQLQDRQSEQKTRPAARETKMP